MPVSEPKGREVRLPNMASGGLVPKMASEREGRSAKQAEARLRLADHAVALRHELLAVRRVLRRVVGEGGHIFVEGLTHSKADGKDEGIPVHPSNVVVVKVDDSDPIRLKKLQSRNGGDDE